MNRLGFPVEKPSVLGWADPREGERGLAAGKQAGRLRRIPAPSAQQKGEPPSRRFPPLTFPQPNES